MESMPGNTGAGVRDPFSSDSVVGNIHSIAAAAAKGIVVKGRSTNIDAKVRLMRSWRRSKEEKAS